MPDLSEPVVCRFDDFLLDRQAGTLWRVHPDGCRTSVPLGARALQILCLLVDRRGEIISSREIMDVVWRNLSVEPNNLTVQLTTLRRVLDATRVQGSCIQNVPGRGYRFLPEVTDISPSLRDSHVAAQADDAQAANDAPTDQPPPVPTAPGMAARSQHRHIAWVAAASLCTAAAVSAAAWYAGRSVPSQIEATIASAPATPASMPPVERPRLSLVVLPFSNFGGERLDEDTVDAITEDLTSDLARLSDTMVIARNSAFTYKGKPIDVRRVGEELGVRYVVEGSVRRSDSKLRVSAQLVSTETGAHLWADRFEVGRDGVGYGVDDIVRQIAFALQIRVIDIESIRGTRERPVNPDVTDLLLRARAVYNQPPNLHNRAQVAALYEQALELDPSSVRALAGLAEALLDMGPPGSENPTEPARMRRADALITRAEQVRPDDRQVMFNRMYLLGQQDRCPEAIPAAQRAIQAHPSLSGTHQWLAICLIRDGRPADAVPAIEQSIRTNPRNPQVHFRYRLMGFALLFLDRYDEAILWLQKALAANPNDGAKYRGISHAAIAAAQALAGRTAAAQTSATQASALFPAITARSYPPFRLTGPALADQLARVRDGLRLAGIRDHTDADANSGVPPDELLHTDYEAPTPTAVPGARVIRAAELVALLEERRPLILDVGPPWGQSIPGAIGLWGAGIGGSFSDQFQYRLAPTMQQLTGGDRTMPIVAVGFNSERYQGRNLALRLRVLGYTEVYWYRGGREAWQVAGQPVAELVLQDW